MFLKSTDKKELTNIVSYVNSKKASALTVYFIEYYFF